MPRLRSARARVVEIATHLVRCRVRFWHDPSVPATARVGPEVGDELPMLPSEHRLSAMEGRPSVAGKPSSRQTVRGPARIVTAARDPKQTSRSRDAVLHNSPHTGVKRVTPASFKQRYDRLTLDA